MIPAPGARTALETRMKDGGYRVSGCPAEAFTVLPTVLLANPRHGYQLPSEPHRCLIGTGLAARIAHLISVGGMTTATGGIGVEPVIRGVGDSRAITIDVDIARSRSAPGEVHRLAPVHFVSARGEGDLPGCRCGCGSRCRRCCRGRGRGRSSCRRGRRCVAVAVAVGVGDAVDVGAAVGVGAVGVPVGRLKA
jgi:hypothetical protein